MTPRRTFRISSLALAIALIMLGWNHFPGKPGRSLEAAPAASDELNLVFAVYTSDKATVMYRTFTPVIDALSGHLARGLGRPVDIEMKIFKTYEAAIDALVAGSVDFVRFGPAPYILSKQKNQHVELLAMEAKNGKKRFEGAFVVAANSKIRRLQDLKGRKVAFGNEKSTIGRYLSQAALMDAGIFGRDLASFSYLGRHDKVVRAVQIGDFDAGAAKMSTVRKLNKNKKLRVLHTFENVTKPWVARSGLEPRVVEGLRRALLALKDEKALEHLRVSGFLPTSDQEYEFIRTAMQRSSQFERPAVSRD